MGLCVVAGAVNSGAVETGLDDLAEKLSVDPIDLRLANLLPPHSATITGFRVTSIGMRECLERVKKESGWDEKFPKDASRKGIGIGCGFFILWFRDYLFIGIRINSTCNSPSENRYGWRSYCPYRCG